MNEKIYILPLTKEELKLHQDARNCYIFGKRILKKNLLKAKIIEKVEIFVIIKSNIEIKHIVFII